MRTPYKQTFLQLLLVLGLCFTLPATAASNGEFDALVRQAEDGSVEAQYEVGRLYYNGVGIPQDRGEALKWFLKAGERQHAQAAFALGTIYDEKGQGVTQNRVEAYRWYNLAAASGMYVADLAREALLQKISKEEVLDAQRLSRETVMLQQ